jgi:hypothetical protein
MITQCGSAVSQKNAKNEKKTGSYPNELLNHTHLLVTRAKGESSLFHPPLFSKEMRGQRDGQEKSLVE